MVTVWKYPLEITDYQALSVPRGALPLCVQTQSDRPRLWMRLNPSAPQKQMDIFIHGTGHELESPSAKYLGTFQMGEEELVFHVFWEWTVGGA